MADSRTDRQLMRQRGAGLRNVETIDFGFTFGSRGTREDRQLMRQRGAGRKVDNIDFGFSFPTPSQSRRSSRTPQTVHKNLRRFSKTPLSSSGRQAPTPTLPPNTTESQDALARQPRWSKTPPRDVEPIKPNSGKRRRTSKNVEGLNAISRPPQPLPEGLTVTRNRRSQIAIRTEDDGATSHQDAEKTQDRHLPSSPLFVPQDEDKENMISAKHDISLTGVQRTRRSLLRQPKAIENDSSEISLVEPTVQSIEEPEIADILGGSGHASTTELNNLGEETIQPGRIHHSVSVDATEAAEHTAESEAAPRKRKKRKSVILGPRKKRRSSETTRRSLSAAEAEVSVVEEDTRPIEPESQEGREEARGATGDEPDMTTISEKPLPLWKRLAARRMQGRRNRLSVSTSPPPREHEDEEADGTYVEEDGSPEPITPAAKRKKKTNMKEPRKSSSNRPHNATKGISSNRKSFPIVTYRATNIEALPTIAEEEDDDGEDPQADEARPPDVFSTRSQPNAVDILAQICRETIQTALGKLGANPTESTSRAEIKHKRAALEAFGNRIDQRLFDMSQAVEQRLTSEARLRKSRREKAGLQARWIEVRRQRDEIALRSDAIRRQNWEDEEEGRRRFEVSELAHRAELELERDFSVNEPAAAGDDLEFMLRHVADKVGTANGQGGILSRVKAFNSQLEKLAVALEGR